MERVTLNGSAGGGQTHTRSVTHTCTFQVRSYELDRKGEIGHAVLLQWFQETAFQASAALGYGMKKYDELGAAWVMRGIDVEYLQPARYLDVVEVTTWVSDFQRVRSHREYQARRAADAAVIARARVDWVFLDSKTFALRRVPAEAVELFQPSGDIALQPIEWPAIDGEDAVERFESTRRVQEYELDRMQHVNNTVYSNWIEELAIEAWRDWGRNPDELALSRHFIEYRQPAKAGEGLTLVTRAKRISGKTAWSHRILRGDTLIVQAHSISR
jgi:YbgC/YbaW family acyl-CoA thioester hydrolase